MIWRRTSSGSGSKHDLVGNGGHPAPQAPPSRYVIPAVERGSGMPAALSKVRLAGRCDCSTSWMISASRMQNISCLVLPIPAHAFFKQAILQVRSATTSFKAVASRRRSFTSPDVAARPCRPPTGACRLEELLTSRNTSRRRCLPGAKLRDVLLAAQPFQHDADIRRQTRQQYSAERRSASCWKGCAARRTSRSFAAGRHRRLDVLRLGPRSSRGRQAPVGGRTARAATSGEVKDLRREATALKEVVADLTLENRLLKKA